MYVVRTGLSKRLRVVRVMGKVMGDFALGKP